MWRKKFGKLLIAFLISRHYNCSLWWMEKLRLGGTKFRNLLIASLISRQRKKLSSQNQPFSALYTKNRPFCAFSQNVSTVDNIAIEQKKRPYERCRKMEFAQLFVAG